MTEMNLDHPKYIRKEIRESRILGNTSGLCPGYVQGNLVIIPQEYANDFEQFERFIDEFESIELVGRLRVNRACEIAEFYQLSRQRPSLGCRVSAPRQARDLAPGRRAEHSALSHSDPFFRGSLAGLQQPPCFQPGRGGLWRSRKSHWVGHLYD